ncbi:MAG: hypothetical protein NXH88_03890 [Hyphomonas sp.]|nr:hypothetical protein [Hyphomonas sp.]
MAKDKAKGGGLLGDRLDSRAEVKSPEEFRRRARALGFSEREIDVMARRYGWSKEEKSDDRMQSE